MNRVVHPTGQALEKADVKYPDQVQVKKCALNASSYEMDILLALKTPLDKKPDGD